MFKSKSETSIGDILALWRAELPDAELEPLNEAGTLILGCFLILSDETNVSAFDMNELEC